MPPTPNTPNGYVQHGSLWVPEGTPGGSRGASTGRGTALHNSFANTARSRTRGGTRGPVGSVNAHRDSRTLEQLIPECQQVARNDLIAKAIVAARADAIVGDDPIFEAQSGDEDWNTEVERRFDEWCMTRADLSGTMTFAQICTAIVNNMDDSGGSLIYKYIQGSGSSATLRLETIEIQRLVNPGRRQDSRTLHGGVAISETTGAPMGYYIGQWNDQGTMVTPATEPVDASNFWLINNPRGLRPGQHRAEPMLACVLDRLETIDQSTEASWDAYQLAAMIALFIKKHSLEGPSLAQQQAAALVTAGIESSTQTAIERGTWAPGQIIEGLVGEEVQTISPSHPVAGFDVMLWTELQNIFAAMDMPMELVSMRFVKNYAASRSAIAVAWQRIKFYQTVLVNRFMIPVFRCWVCNEIQTGRIKEVEGWKNCDWYMPVMPVLDAKVEAEAELLKLSGTLTTHDRSLRLMGSGRRRDFIPRWVKEQAENARIGLQYARPINQIQSESKQVDQGQAEDEVNTDA